MKRSNLTLFMLTILMSFMSASVLTRYVVAQGILVSEAGTRLPRIVIIDAPYFPRPPRPMPPTRPIPQPEPAFSYRISALDVNAVIKDIVAEVNVAQTFVNTGKAQMEVSFIFPIPQETTVEQFTLLVDGKELPATLQKADEARKTYEEIVRKSRDPALLEWVGNGMLRSSVFPVPAGEKRTIQLKYTQLCRSFEGMTDFIFPFGATKYTDKPIEKTSVRVAVESSAEIRNIYSPTLDLKTERPTAKNAIVTWELTDALPPADFRLMFDVGREAVQTKILSYRPKNVTKDETTAGKMTDSTHDDGFFLVLAAPGVKAEEKSIAKSVFFVLDNSGSMMGKKIAQAKKAAQFVLEHLSDGDIFNIIVFNSSVTQFSPEPLVLDAENRKVALAYVEQVYASGGTDIHSALLNALNQIAKTDTQRPNYILFLTDGCPTVGVCNEAKIAEAVKEANTKKSRIFAFGAGFDLNSRLVDKLVTESAGQSEFIRPNEDIEERVSRLYRKLHAPILSDVVLKFEGENGTDLASTLGVSRVYPAGNFDIFSGEQLAISGRYHTPGNGKLTLAGKTDAQEQVFTTEFKFVDVSEDSSFAFVEKLWVIRRIGEIIDELDLKGKNDELVQELIQLSKQYGILTPYTAFLANENTSLTDTVTNLSSANARVDALQEIQGSFGVSQRAFKGSFRNAQNSVQMSNAQMAFDNDNSSALIPQVMNAPKRKQMQNAMPIRGRSMQNSRVDAVPEENIQEAEQKIRTIENRTFFFKGGQWVDNTLTEAQQNAKPIEIEVFSDAYFDLISRFGKEITPYLVFDEPILVNVNQQAYLVK